MPKQKKIPGPPTQANGTREPKSLNNILTQLASKINKIRKTDGKADKPKISPMDYWVQRAKAVGLSDLQINMLLLKSEGALRDKVREIERARESVSVFTVPVEQNSLELSCVFNVDPAFKAHTREITLKNGKYLIIRTNPDVGLPTEFDLNLLLATYKLAQRHNFQEFTTTIYQILKAMNLDPAAKTLYEAVKRGIIRLAHAVIETNNYFNPQDRKREYIAFFRFYDIIAYSKDTKKVNIKFSQVVERSIATGYLKAVDCDKALQLRGYAKILYLQLIKLAGDKSYLELTEETVLRWLGKWEKYSSLVPSKRRYNVKQFIDTAVDIAVEALNGQVIKQNSVYQITFRKKRSKAPKTQPKK